MFNFFKNLLEFFTSQPPARATGALENTPDTRDIPFAAVSVPSAVPEKHETDISMLPVYDQGPLGTCVAHAFVLAKQFLDWVETGRLHLYSRRFLYSLTRKFAKLTEQYGQGLSPRDCAKVIVSVGVDIERGQDNDELPHAEYVEYYITSEMRIKANEGKAKGYAFVQNDKEEMMRAVHQTGFVMATLAYEPKSWKRALIKKIKKFFGLHYIFIYGYQTTAGDVKFKFRNSWGLGWGNSGNGEFYYSEYQKYLKDMLVITDLPNDILKRAKDSRYVFLRDLKLGMDGEDVGRLQEYCIAKGLLEDTVDRKFGPKLKDAVVQLQRLHNLPETGFFGPQTREVVNMDNKVDPKPQSRLDIWCGAIKRMEGAKEELNNPGNIKCDNIFHKSAIGMDKRGICKFPTYEAGYLALRTLLVNAATGKSSNYHPEETLQEFYAGVPMPNRFGRTIYGYAPEADNNKPNTYAAFVAKYIGVPATTKIKDLV